MTTQELELEAVADASALVALAVKHSSEFARLRTVELARLTGTTPVFRRNRWTQEQLAQLPPVTDANGVPLEPGVRVKCPDGVRAKVERVDRRSQRCVVKRSDGTLKMTTATRLTTA